MSLVSQSSTLRRRAEDSLCADDFEIISDYTSNDDREDSSVSSPHPHNDISHVLAEFTPATVSIIPKLNSLSSMAAPTLEPTLSETENTIRDNAVEETPILEGTVNESLLSEETPDATLSGMLRSNSETRKSLEATLAQFETLSKDLASITSYQNEIISLKNQNTELSERVHSLEEKLRSNDESVVGRASSERDEIQAFSKESDTLKKELEEARVAMKELEEEKEKTRYLSNQLDEMCAKYLTEKERRQLVETQFENYKSDNVGHSAPPSYINETMLLRQLQDKTKYAELVESELQNTRKENEDNKKKLKEAESEISDLKEIINVLKEDHTEGTRIIASHEHKISDLERILRSLERIQD